MTARKASRAPRSRGRARKLVVLIGRRPRVAAGRGNAAVPRRLPHRLARRPRRGAAAGGGGGVQAVLIAARPPARQRPPGAAAQCREVSARTADRRRDRNAQRPATSSARSRAAPPRSSRGPRPLDALRQAIGRGTGGRHSRGHAAKEMELKIEATAEQILASSCAWRRATTRPRRRPAASAAAPLPRTVLERFFTLLAADAFPPSSPSREERARAATCACRRWSRRTRDGRWRSIRVPSAVVCCTRTRPWAGRRAPGPPRRRATTARDAGNRT